MYESTPFIELMFQATIPLFCPGCVLTIPILDHIGLTMSNCSFTLLSDTYTVLRIRAVPTAGRNARIVSLNFGAIDATGSPWHQLQLHRILVYCSHYLLLVSTLQVSCLSLSFISSVTLDENTYITATVKNRIARYSRDADSCPNIIKRRNNTAYNYSRWEPKAILKANNA